MTDVLKQSVMLVLALGGIVALLADRDDSNDGAQTSSTTAPQVQQYVQEYDDSAEEEDDYWGDEGIDDDVDYEFGEPMIQDESEEVINSNPVFAGGNVSNSGGAAPSNIGSGSRGIIVGPAPGEVGSSANPAPPGFVGIQQ